MKDLRRLVLIVTLSASCPIVKAHSPQKPSGLERRASNSSSDERGTKDTPLVIEKSTAQSKDEADQHSSDITEQKRVNSWNIGLTTGIAVCALFQFLGIFGQILVYLKQTKIMRDTLAAINAQATHMASQLTEMKAANMSGSLVSSEILGAIKRQADAMARQIWMIKDQYRARIEIKAGDLTLDQITETSWNLEAGLKIRNLGPSRAYVSRFQTEVVWCKLGEDEPVPDFTSHNNTLPDDFLDPTKLDGSPHQQPVYFWHTRSIALDWFANGIFSGEIRLFMYALIVYSTVGTTYKRFVTFEWKGSGRPDSMAYALRALGGSPPRNNNEMISAGFWSVRFDKEGEIESSEEAYCNPDPSRGDPENF